MSRIDRRERHSHDMDQSSEPWIISFQDTSQYSKGGPSACGLAAVNAARDILTVLSSADPEHNPLEYLEKEETATAIMSICSYWESNEHLDVQDILNLPFFSCHLETKRVEDNQCGIRNFTKLTESLVSDGAVAAVVTRSPEIVAIINAPKTPFGNVTIVFDSHPRPEHPLGAAFLMYQNPKDAAAYLDKLFEVDPAIMRDLSWQTQMLSRYSAHVISLKYSTEEETIASVYDANIKLLNYSETIKIATEREAANQAELSALRDVLKRQREAREKACLEEEEAARKLERLRKEVESARQFVFSLVNGNGPSSHGYDDRGPRRTDEPMADKKGKGNQHTAQPSMNTGWGWGASASQTKKTSGSPYYGYHKPSRKREETKSPTQDRNERTKPPTQDRDDSNHHRTPAARAHNTVVDQGIHTDFDPYEPSEDERRSYELARRLQMKEEQDWLQREELIKATAHDRGFNCGLCLEDYSEGNIARVDVCRHGTCRECMRHHIGAQLEQRRWPIICAICVAEPDQPGELGVISRDLAEMVGLNEDMMRAWHKIEIERVAIKVECPKCNKAYYADVGDFNQIEMLWCQEADCDAYWCKKCNQPAQRGFRHTCDGEAEMERYLEADKTIKKCPGCQALVQRREGCYHMTCTTPDCNTHFCDRCGKLIVKSFKKAEIDDAVRKHFNDCQLFDIPNED